MVPFFGPAFWKGLRPSLWSSLWNHEIWTRSKKQHQMQSENCTTMCGIQSYSLNCKQKERVVPARCMIRMYALVLHFATTMEALCARAHFLRVFSLINPPTVKNSTPSRRCQQKLHFAPLSVHISGKSSVWSFLAAIGVLRSAAAASQVTV